MGLLEVLGLTAVITLLAGVVAVPIQWGASTLSEWQPIRVPFDKLASAPLRTIEWFENVFAGASELAQRGLRYAAIGGMVVVAWYVIRFVIAAATFLLRLF